MNSLIIRRQGFLAAAVFLAIVIAQQLSAQDMDATPLRIFGYFQTSFSWAKNVDTDFVEKSFGMQQLNLFLQRDISSDFRAFVNFEVLNSFNSRQNWGSLSVEEAWVRWNRGDRFNLRVGLQTPTFNALNEIKNRTPLLVYVIRPLAYESSFNEIIRLEEYTPQRAYLQASGFVPVGEAKIEGAAYLGNSPNLRSDPQRGQTGFDTSDTYLVGGRLGLRWREFVVGGSITYDRYNFQSEISGLVPDEGMFREVPRTRLGFDARGVVGKLAAEGEFIQVSYDERNAPFSVDLRFFYGTLILDVTERLKVYASYWNVREESAMNAATTGIGGVINELIDQRYDFNAISGGLVYQVNDRMVFKLQSAPVSQELKLPDVEYEADFNYIVFGLSVRF